VWPGGRRGVRHRRDIRCAAIARTPVGNRRDRSRGGERYVGDSLPAQGRRHGGGWFPRFPRRRNPHRLRRGDGTCSERALVRRRCGIVGRLAGARQFLQCHAAPAPDHRVRGIAVARRVGRADVLWASADTLVAAAAVLRLSILRGNTGRLGLGELQGTG